MLTNKTILITGGTGSFGNTPVLMTEYNSFESIKTNVHGAMETGILT